jgi:hypothetical protein
MIAASETNQSGEPVILIGTLVWAMLCSNCYYIRRLVRFDGRQHLKRRDIVTRTNRAVINRHLITRPMRIVRWWWSLWQWMKRILNWIANVPMKNSFVSIYFRSIWPVPTIDVRYRFKLMPISSIGRSSDRVTTDMNASLWRVCWLNSSSCSIYAEECFFTYHRWFRRLENRL